ncbi:MAG: DUF2520 domain-containing protein [Agriterribacter sp.]
MKVVMIGTGNVAHVLGHRIKEAGHTVLQVAGRDETKTPALAKLLDAASCVSFSSISSEADIYIIALSDTALENVIKELHFKGIVVHTAGAVSKNVLQNVSGTFGVLYPLQSLRSDRLDVGTIPLLIDGNTRETIEQLHGFAKTISTVIEHADDNKRIKAHIAAVITNNFSNFLYTLTHDFCEKENINFSLLTPLLHETVARLAQHTPAAMQTGPAVRQDKVTIAKHLLLLNQYPLLQQVYETLSNDIMRYYSNYIKENNID